MYNELFLASYGGKWYLRGLVDEVQQNSPKPLVHTEYDLTNLHKVTFTSSQDLSISEVSPPGTSPILNEEFSLDQNPMLRIVGHNQFKLAGNPFHGVIGIEDIEPSGVTTHVIPFTNETKDIYLMINPQNPSMLVIRAY